MDGLLRTLGLDPIEAQLYETLLQLGPCGAADAGSATSLPRDRVRRALAALEAKGLVSRTPGSRSTYAPASPDLALDALLLRRENELAGVRRDLRQFVERFGRLASQRAERLPIELVSGRDAVAQWWVQIQRSARSEVLIFDKPPYAMLFTGPNPVELELMERGVAYRVLYDASSFDGDAKRTAVQACIAAGENARVRAGVPIKLLVADQTLALTHDGADVHESAIVVRRSAVLGGLVALFDALWRDAVPVSESGQSAGKDGLDELDHSILTMLAAGAKDERIARQLRLSVRTVRRRTTRLMEHFGAQTRFQAAVIATRNDII